MAEGVGSSVPSGSGFTGNALGNEDLVRVKLELDRPPAWDTVCLRSCRIPVSRENLGGSQGLVRLPRGSPTPGEASGQLPGPASSRWPPRSGPPAPPARGLRLCVAGSPANLPPPLAFLAWPSARRDRADCARSLGCYRLLVRGRGPGVSLRSGGCSAGVLPFLHLAVRKCWMPTACGRFVSLLWPERRRVFLPSSPGIMPSQ